ncbi:MAG: type I DNA topoisomerase [Clostridia bacterium]|nr:type I DNA topoisomerase [Clostridia bacterium]
MKLVIIESPNKSEALKKYLGEGFKVIASKGHVRDLPVKALGVDINNNFEPTYETLSDKKAIVETLKKEAELADEVYIASDPDREGEAIAWHIAHYLGLKAEDKCRITFNEISKTAVQHSLTVPRTIDQSLVDAQQARRILDRLVGYKVSPIICKKIKPNLSAGRVQSVALKLVVDREREIINFKPEEYWNVSVDLNKFNDNLKFKALATAYKGKKVKFKNAQEVEDATKGIETAEYKISKIKRSKTSSHAPAPFTTSTMQQEALAKAGLSSSRTSKAAQTLYEGVDIAGEGKVALITYIRTDSTRVSEGAMQMAKDYILKEYGNKFLPSKPNVYGSKKDAQDAHEAIRPISLDRRPDLVKSSLSSDTYKLYKLIYERFLASQMSPAQYDNVTVDVEANDLTFRVSGKTMTFAGWTSAYRVQTEVTEEAEAVAEKLPPMEEGEVLNFNAIKKEQKFTKPPARYNEGTLIKAMDEKGIGRPATYAPTLALLASRDYTAKDGKYLYPTETGMIVTDFLQKYFDSVINVDFTADMENKLDQIAENTAEWRKVIAKFWRFLEPLLTNANGGEKMRQEPEKTDIKCEKCGHLMVIRDGRYGKFLGCSNFPTCKNIQPLNPVKTIYKGICPKCGKQMTERKSKAGKIYYSCEDFENCKFMSWDEPTGKLCPECKEHLVRKTIKDKTTIKCSNKSCKYVEE